MSLSCTEIVTFGVIERWVGGVFKAGTEEGAGMSGEDLKVACERGEMGEVLRLLREPGVDVNALVGAGKQGRGETALTAASLGGQLEIVQVLVQAQGIDVNRRDGYGLTPLYYACGHGHLEIVQVLVRVQEGGIDVNLPGGHGITPLHRASQGGYLKVVQVLLQVKGIDVNRRDGFGLTPLYYASSRGHLQVVQALLQVRGIDASAAARDGRTPLYCACWHGHLQVVETLLRVPDIDLNATDRQGWTPLYVACLCGHAQVVTALVWAGADVNLGDKRGCYPLHVLRGAHEGVEECVLSVRATAGPPLMVLLLGGLPHRIAYDIIVMRCLSPRHRMVAELLRAGATVLRRSGPLRQRGQ